TLSPDLRFRFLSAAAGGFLGDILSTHIIPTVVTHRRSPALSTWWLYLIVGLGITGYLLIGAQSLNPIFFAVGSLSFISLWPSILFLRALLPSTPPNPK